MQTTTRLNRTSVVLCLGLFLSLTGCLGRPPTVDLNKPNVAETAAPAESLPLDSPQDDASRLAEPTSVASPLASQEPGWRTERVSFTSGSSSATLSDGVVRGERVVYLLEAARQQNMLVNITSEENNAVFDIVAPDGTVLTQEVMDASVVLPKDGDYQIIVGGTRGNASYTINVVIP